jgi:hypothetical protein
VLFALAISKARRHRLEKLEYHVSPAPRLLTCTIRRKITSAWWIEDWHDRVSNQTHVSTNARCLTCIIYKVYTVASKSPNQMLCIAALCAVSNRQVLLSPRSPRSLKFTMQVGTRACTASPSHHMTVRLTSSAAYQPIFALAGRPCISSVSQSV